MRRLAARPRNSSRRLKWKPPRGRRWPSRLACSRSEVKHRTGEIMNLTCPFTNVAGPAVDSLPLPSYFPPDAIKLTRYADVLEVLRSGKVFGLDASYDHTRPLTRGAV